MRHLKSQRRTPQEDQGEDLKRAEDQEAGWRCFFSRGELHLTHQKGTSKAHPCQAFNEDARNNPPMLVATIMEVDQVMTKAYATTRKCEEIEL